MLATDGVWEVMTCQEVAHFVQRWRKRPWAGWSASDALTLEAQERWKLLQPEVRSVRLHRLSFCCLMPAFSFYLRAQVEAPRTKKVNFWGHRQAGLSILLGSVWAFLVLDKICTF